MRNMIGVVVVFAFVIAIIVIAAIFVPIIFGSAEASIDLTNNTTHMQYNATTSMVMTGQTLLWVGAILVGLFMLVAVLIWKR